MRQFVSFSRHALIAALALLVAALALHAPAGAAPLINHNGGTVALNGYDPVAYFTDGKPVMGSEQFSTDWMGATWNFASAEHRDKFVAMPEKYAPQYGGWCAYGVAKGAKAKTEPELWSIVDGKLYLNYNQDIQDTWKSDPAAYIAAADKNWTKVKDK